jgi:O-antigen/teichoic acid export membrane protein
LDRARKNSLAAIFTAATGVATALIGTPLIIDHVGKSGYGVWAISMAAVIYLGIVEAGFAPVVQRRVASALGAGDDEGLVRVFWSTVFFYLALGIAGAAIVYVLAPAVVPVFGFPPSLEDQSVALFRLVALAIPLGLLMAALTNALQGAERFQAVAVTAVCGAVAYLGALVALIQGDASLSELGWAVIAQLVVLILLRGALVLGVALTRPRLVSRDEAREMASMSARLQVSVASLIVNGQSDRVVAGLVSPAATVAQVSVAAQVAEAGRLVAAAPLVPAANRFAALDGAGDRSALGRLFTRSDRLWSSAVAGAVAIGALCAVPLVEAWLGSGFREAGVFAAVLVVAYGASIAFGVRTALLRAIGRPGLESRTGLLLMALNLAFTVPLALIFQAPGVVAGTLLAYLAGSAWFASRFRRVAPEFEPAGLAVVAAPLAWGIAFGAVAGAWSFAAVAVVPPGWALVPVAGGMAAGAAGFLRFGLKTGPRALFRSLGGE